MSTNRICSSIMLTSRSTFPKIRADINHDYFSLLWELELWPVNANKTSGAIYWTMKHWSLKKSVGMMFIKLWYIILLLSTIILMEKYWKFSRKLSLEFSGKIWNFLGIFFCPTSLTKIIADIKTDFVVILNYW